MRWPRIAPKTHKLARQQDPIPREAECLPLRKAQTGGAGVSHVSFLFCCTWPRHFLSTLVARVAIDRGQNVPLASEGSPLPPLIASVLKQRLKFTQRWIRNTGAWDSPDLNVETTPDNAWQRKREKDVSGTSPVPLKRKVRIPL